MPARPTTLSFFALSMSFAVTLVAERMARPSIAADDLGELILVEAGLHIDRDAAVLEDLHGGGREPVGDEDFGGHDAPLVNLLPDALSRSRGGGIGQRRQ